MRDLARRCESAGFFLRQKYQIWPFFPVDRGNRFACRGRERLSHEKAFDLVHSLPRGRVVECPPVLPLCRIEQMIYETVAAVDLGGAAAFDLESLADSCARKGIADFPPEWTLPAWDFAWSGFGKIGSAFAAGA